LASLREPDAILYRQRILADCLEQPETVRALYGMAVEAAECERKVWNWSSRYPDSVLHRSVDVLKLFVGLLKKLRHAADEHGPQFRSEGFTRLLGMLVRELGDEYLRRVEDHLAQLAFRHGILISAELGVGNKGTHYILRQPQQKRQKWTERLQSWIEQLPLRNRPPNVYEIADRDESGLRALSDLRGRGIGRVAAALAQSTDHILSFFRLLQWELGFYIGCLNLRDQLARKGEPLCFPVPRSTGRARLSSQGLYDVCLSLSVEEKVIGNEVSGDDKLLLMITGANRGGKSTFLRSMGLAQLMMQCGLFVSAESFAANVCHGLFTHFKREEDASMKSGKLDEELSRMSSIIDHLSTTSIVLLNESFASTNEREGSEIARQIVRALLETGIKVFYVTHLFDLAQGFYLAAREDTLFLRAERLAGGGRTFRLVQGEPLPTSYGEDLYRRIFGKFYDAAAAAPLG
jgi:DNA mismatch repair ATPase MutS